MYSYLYDNKFLLWITVIFMFIGVITVTIITYMFILSIIEKKRDKKRKKEMKKLSETLYSGDYVKVIKTFKDYYGFTHQVGEKWYFASQYSLLSEYGDVLYISTDKINVDTIYLEDRKDNLYAHPEEYFEILEQGRFKR